MEHIAIVRRRTRPQIEALAQSARLALGLGANDRVAMLPILELALPRLLGEEYICEVVTDDRLPGAEAQVNTVKPQIVFRQTTYDALMEGNVRARFTAAHELGHLLMHSGEHIHYARALRHTSEQVDPEWQADCFAAAFLMPEDAFRECCSNEEAQERFGVGFRAANLRARTLRHSFKLAAKLASKRKGGRK